jgi:hypothetical protein
MAEVEQFSAAAYYGLGIVPYSPLARGVLSGKYAPDAAPPADSRAARGDARMMQTEWRPESLAIAQKLKAHAEALGMPLSQFALAWMLENRLVTSVICGPAPKPSCWTISARSVASCRPPARRWSTTSSRPGIRRRPVIATRWSPSRGGRRNDGPGSWSSGPRASRSLNH